MGAEKKLLPVKEAFQLAQQPHQNQAKLVVALSRTYRTVSAARGLGRRPSPPWDQLPPGASHDLPDSNLLNQFGEAWRPARRRPGTPSPQQPPARTVKSL